MVKTRENRAPSLSAAESMLEASDDGFWSWPDLRVGAQWWSPGFCELLGLDTDGGAGSVDAFIALAHPDERGVGAAALGELLRGHASFQTECRLKTRRGEYRWFIVRGCARCDGKGAPAAMAGFVRDITERRIVDEARDRMAAIVQSSDDAIIGKTLDGIVFSWNEGAERMYGYSAREMLGEPLACLVLPDRTDELPQILERIARGERVEHFETTRRKKDGTLLCVSLNASPIKDSAGRITGVSTIARDVTERKRHEEEKAALEVYLHQSHKLHAVGQLAAGVAHDFRNLLMVIGGHVDMARNALPADHAAQAHLANVTVAAGQATEISRALLTFGGRLEAHFELISPAEAVEDAARLLQHLLPKSIELTVVVEREPAVCILADRAQITQVVLNLAMNARDAMPQGGQLKIACMPTGASTSPDTACAPREVRIEVSDTGVGMPSELQERLFEPFFTTKPRGQGIGLGLPIVHGIVHRLGGSIDVKSAPWMGSTFTVTLPCHVGASTAADSPSIRESSRGRGEILLIADDNPLLLRMLTGAMESLGYGVIQARDGRNMLDGWSREKSRIGAIIADIDMPGLSGTDALNRMRDAGCGVPAVLITGSAPEGRRPSDPKTTVLRKPFQVAALAAHIRSALDGREERQVP